MMTSFLPFSQRMSPKWWEYVRQTLEDFAFSLGLAGDREGLVITPNFVLEETPNSVLVIVNGAPEYLVGTMPGRVLQITEEGILNMDEAIEDQEVRWYF